MLVINKIALNYSSQVNCLLLTQTTASVALILGLVQSGMLHMPDVSFRRGVTFAPIMLVWLLPMLLNMKCLSHTNVETVVMFRLLSVVPTAVGDFVLFNVRFGINQILTLLLMVFGAIMYAYADIRSTSEGNLWSFVYMTATTFNSLFIKYKFSIMDGIGQWEKTLVCILL